MHVVALRSMSGYADVTGLPQRGPTLGEAGDWLPEEMLRTANGRLTAAEAPGHRQFVLTRPCESC